MNLEYLELYGIIIIIWLIIIAIVLTVYSYIQLAILLLLLLQFPDSSKNGEWYGYLDRQGNVTHTFKGGPYKG